MLPGIPVAKSPTVGGPAPGNDPHRTGIARRWTARRSDYLRNAWVECGRGVLCLGESTAESGPRCGEAEEAKRRPAFNLAGSARATAARRLRAPGASLPRRPRSPLGPGHPQATPPVCASFQCRPLSLGLFPVDPSTLDLLSSPARSCRFDSLCTLGFAPKARPSRRWNAGGGLE